MFKGYAIKDIFYLLLGSLLVIGIIMAYITMGGWGELTHSSQSSKVIHKQQKRTVRVKELNNFLKLILIGKLLRQPTISQHVKDALVKPITRDMM